MPAWAITSVRSPAMSLSLKTTRPTGGTSPMIALHVVERPTPFRPRRLTISPCTDAEVHALQDVALAVERVEVVDGEHQCAGGAEVGVLHRPVGADVRGRTGGDDLAIDQHGDDVGQVEHDAHVVLDHDEGLALGHAADQRDGVVRLAAAHARGGLVQQDGVGAARRW